MPIADGILFAYRADMARFLVLVAALALCACDQTPSVKPAKRVELESGHLRLPFDSSSGFLDGYSLRVTYEGELFWNGVPVSEAMLRDYLQQWSARPRDAGKLFVAFETGVPQSRADWVRREVIDSGLCEQRRCAEVGWDVKRPVVN